MSVYTAEEQAKILGLFILHRSVKGIVGEGLLLLGRYAGSTYLSVCLSPIEDHTLKNYHGKKAAKGDGEAAAGTGPLVCKPWYHWSSSLSRFCRDRVTRGAFWVMVPGVHVRASKQGKECSLHSMALVCRLHCSSGFISMNLQVRNFGWIVPLCTTFFHCAPIDHARLSFPDSLPDPQVTLRIQILSPAR